MAMREEEEEKEEEEVVVIVGVESSLSFRLARWKTPNRFSRAAKGLEEVKERR